MAFVAVVPAVASFAAPAIGAIGSGLGAAASGIGGLAASGLGALGGVASGIPVIGSTLGGAIGGLGSGIGALGSGLGGGLTALGAGNIPGAFSSLGSGLLGAGSNLIGGVGGSLYGGADQLLGGMLPNIGGVGITPAQGYMGNLFPNAVGQNPMFGGRAMQDAHIQAFNAAKGNMAHIDAYNAAQGGGMLGGGMLGKGLGALGKIGQTAGAINAARNIFDPPGATQPGVYGDRVIQRNMQDQPSNQPIIYGGGQTPVNSSVNLTGQPQAMLQTAPMGAGPAGAAYRDEISELVEEAMASKDNADRRRQSDSLKGTYGGRTTSLA
jgi:hypothetical protein